LSGAIRRRGGGVALGVVAVVDLLLLAVAVAVEAPTLERGFGDLILVVITVAIEEETSSRETESSR
jgi:hypothetical protein